MTTTAVLEHFDVLEQVGLRVLMRAVAYDAPPFIHDALREPGHALPTREQR